MVAKANERSGWIVLAIVLGVPAVFLVSSGVSTHQRMAQYRMRTPGMTVDQLVAFAGPPDVILHRGEPLLRARRSYVVPDLDEHTAIYFYPKSAIPYYNVYVFVDEAQGEVIRSDVENLWW